MRKILLYIFMFLLCVSPTFADEAQEAMQFFNNYVGAANSYSSAVTSMYAPNAKIIRQVIKPSGDVVNVQTDTNTYIRQLRLGQKTAKFRRYKNTYTNVIVDKVDNGYKISALRQPSGEKYRLKSYMVVQKQPDGNWLIVEEMMQTKVQAFLKYAKN